MDDLTSDEILIVLEDLGKYIHDKSRKEPNVEIEIKPYLDRLRRIYINRPLNQNFINIFEKFIEFDESKKDETKSN